MAYKPTPAQEAAADARRKELIAQLEDGIARLVESSGWRRCQGCGQSAGTATDPDRCPHCSQPYPLWPEPVRLLDGDPDKVRERIRASAARIQQASRTILDGLEALAEADYEAEVA